MRPRRGGVTRPYISRPAAVRLTRPASDGKKEGYGGMAEWFKAAVLKTADRKVRGFESYSLRHLCS